MLSKIITYSFYLLFALTPLIWAPFTYELFEFNKMMFVYALTLVVLACWVLKMIQSKSLILKTTPLDLPLMVFLLANIFSTIFSIDKHISIFGYYSRLNGGLISLISYILLYYALISNFNKEQALNFLKAAVLGGIPVALWSVLEHFGISPSCIILTGQANTSCWIQDVQARVFATLGQPNWLAAYVAMLIFPVFYFISTAPNKLYAIRNTLYAFLFYLAFTFTYSRGATLGLLTGLAVFSATILWLTSKKLLSNSRGLILILSLFITINLFFGSALTDFKLLSKFVTQSRPSLTASIKSGTQLENGGTESGKIRLIVWQGALEIFKHYPIFGSGVETFAYSYYQFRPASHNLVSEWDFLYNKAHNEFLNYLATTGIFGFLSYMAVILTFIVFCIKYFVLSIKGKKHPDPLILALLASYTSYLVQNFFGFSVVITALFFFLFPALAFLATDATKPFQFPKKLYPIPHTPYPLIYKRPFYTKFAQGVVILTFSLSLFTTIKFYLADIYFAQGMKLSDSNPGKAYNTLFKAAALNPQEPFYKSELAYQAAAASLALEKEEATLSSQLKKQAEEQTSSLLLKNPHNVSYFRTAIRTYFLLSSIDQKFADKTLQTLDAALKLAPTDAKLLYNKGIILSQQEKNEEAFSALEQTQKLKPNYKEAYLMLGALYAQEKEWEKAKEQMEKLLKIIPGDPQALEKLTEWQKR